MPSTPIRVSIIQARPIYYDLAATLDKAAELITQAAHDGAKLVVLGETWLPTSDLAPLLVVDDLWVQVALAPLVTHPAA
jgi:predicted amidohydrolase